MLENIELKKFPHSSGVYLFKDIDGEIIYIGSSYNLYERMRRHRTCINTGGEHSGKYKIEFYIFLQSNQFSVEYQLEQNYLQLEQQLIEKHNPKFNNHRAYTGCGSRKGRENEYEKERYQKYKEEYKQYHKQYNSQTCNYNGEILTLNALVMRFLKAGIPHPTLEAKKYLIS